jgi:HEAT repeat protein
VLSDPEFRAALDEARSAVFRDTIGSLRVANTAAVETLRGALSDGPSAVRVRAAVAILQLGTELGEVSGLSTRLAQLEQYAA